MGTKTISIDLEAYEALRFLGGLGEEGVVASAHVVCELLAGAECANDPGREKTRVAALLSALPVAWPNDRFPPAYASLLGCE
jgi:predicted nucleic acid-binding protein